MTAHISSFRNITAHISSFRNITAHISSFRNITAHISSFKTNFSSNFSVKFSTCKIRKSVYFRIRKLSLHLFDRQISSFKLHNIQAIFHLSEIISGMTYEISGRYLPLVSTQHCLLRTLYISVPTHLVFCSPVTLTQYFFSSTTQSIFRSLIVSKSRHTIVCRAAQEAGAPHRGYIDRKKENVISTPLYLGDPLSDWNQICYRVARQPGESTFQI